MFSYYGFPVVLAVLFESGFIRVVAVSISVCRVLHNCRSIVHGVLYVMHVMSEITCHEHAIMHTIGYDMVELTIYHAI